MLPNAVGKKFSMYVNWPLKSTAQLNSPVVQSQSWRQHWHFYPRGAVLARYTSYGPVSVCLSQVGILSNWLYWFGSFYRLILNCFKEILTSKNKGTSPGILVLNSGLRKFRHAQHVDIHLKQQPFGCVPAAVAERSAVSKML